MPTVIDGLLSQRGSATEVPNRNRKLLLGLLISSAASWDEGVGIVLCAKPAALLYENIGLSGFPCIISRVAAEEFLTFIFRFLRDIPLVVGHESEGKT